MVLANFIIAVGFFDHDRRFEKSLSPLKLWEFFLRGGLREFFEGDPYVTYRVPKCVSDD